MKRRNDTEKAQSEMNEAIKGERTHLLHSRESFVRKDHEKMSDDTLMSYINFPLALA